MKKDKKKYSGINLSLGIGVIVVAMFLASLSVLAYEPKQIEIVEEISDSIIVSYEELAWGEEGIYTGDNIEEGWQVVCDDGEIRQLPNEYFEVQEARICFHEYVVCKITKHTTQSGGGCILKIYDGEECSKCNKVKMGELYSTMSFPQCPH